MKKSEFLSVFILLFFGLCYFKYLCVIFENDKHFSHLSNMEREMSFRSEMGFYYYFYKKLVYSDKFINGLLQLTNIQTIEYPNFINAFKRFNIFPEVLLSALYRFSKNFNLISSSDCYRIYRVDQNDHILSCEGLNEPIYFYVYSVFFLHSLSIMALCLSGFYLSNSITGGILLVFCYVFNHEESTRVMWTPPLRESFAYPLYNFHLLYLTAILKRPSGFRFFFFIVFTVFLTITWQFATFILSIELVCLLLLYLFQFLDLLNFVKFINCYLFTYFLSVLLLLGNEFYIGSIYTSVLFAISVFVISVHRRFENKVASHFLFTLVNTLSMIFVVVLFTLTLKFFFRHDSHVWEILKSKFTNYRSFHSYIYTCAPEFDFLGKKTYINLTNTFLLPLGLFMLILCFLSFLKHYMKSTTLFRMNFSFLNRFIFPEIYFHCLQSTFLCMLAICIMRLKVLGTPSLAILCSLVVRTSSANCYRCQNKFKILLTLLILTLMSFSGCKNISQQLNRKNEYSNYALEALLNWITLNTKKEAAFAGLMPTLASVKLITDRAIVLHPHYESSELRNRVENAYSIYSTKPLQKIYQSLRKMAADYFIVESQYCFPPNGVRCSIIDMFHFENRTLNRETLACHKLLTSKTPYFSLEFVLRNFYVFKLSK